MRSRATHLWHPTRVDHLSRNNLTSVCWGSPGPVVLCSLRFFGVCQGPEPCLKSSGLAVCPQSAPSAGPPCPNRPLRHRRESPPASPAIFGPPSRLGPQPSPEAQPRSRARSRALPRPPASVGAVSSHPDWARPYLGSQAPLRYLRCRWGARPASPAALSRPPSRRYGSRLHARPRLRPRAQASGFQCLRRADSGTLRSRRRGPPTLGPLRRLRPTAWTSIGPGKVRFRTFTRRPLRSEIFSHMSCRSRLATLNEKLTALERRIEYIEARVTKGIVQFSLIIAVIIAAGKILTLHGSCIYRVRVRGSLLTARGLRTYLEFRALCITPGSQHASVSNSKTTKTDRLGRLQRLRALCELSFHK
ncbi:hypothetical protein NDU88_006994 [Pleurodeles waltl]|uniref:Uncharacterized protein n=1 Tax=Pleurodeles waltl TaxID=8319 RepID=A0AAV7N2I9_PLEWA|nr:hypothetical protein NDU88_006994 [Pleurodeles waltl]